MFLYVYILYVTLTESVVLISTPDRIAVSTLSKFPMIADLSRKSLHPCKTKELTLNTLLVSLMVPYDTIMFLYIEHHL